MTKRIIAALFALILVLSLCSCTKSDKQKPVPDKILASKSSQSTSETEKTSASEASGSSKTQTSKENKTSQTMKSVTLSNSDKQYFEKMMSYIVGYGLTDMGEWHEGIYDADYDGKSYEYDCTSDKAFNYALNIIFAVPYKTYVDEIAQIYDWRDYYVPDPIVNDNEKIIMKMKKMTTTVIYVTPKSCLKQVYVTAKLRHHTLTKY